MCGIFGYIGKKEAEPILLDGLHLLEYRGYDSAGIAILNGSINIVKTTGNVQILDNKLKEKYCPGKMGIAHTRWATHGKVSVENAHPHLSFSGRFVLVHNGIIENYSALGQLLKANGYVFKGETDSEVLVNWIDYLAVVKQLTVEEVLKQVMVDVHGAYAFVLMDNTDPKRLFAVRQMSPLVVGLSDGEVFLSSDSHALSNYVNRYFIMADHSILILTRNHKPRLINQEGNHLPIEYKELKFTLLDSGLGGLSHYMLKEIYEQPDILSRYFSQGNEQLQDEFADLSNKISEVKRLIILACGTSYHAGLIGHYLIEKYARIPVTVEYAAEFRYRNPVIGPDDLIIGISQSGETADTLAATRMAKEKGAFILSLCNVPESSLARESDINISLGAGTEIGVASTKAFTAQVMKLIQLTTVLASSNGQKPLIKKIHDELIQIPSGIRILLAYEQHIKDLAYKFSHCKNFLFLGRGINYPVALEGALKLKEISYIHAEGCPASEMKHGPIALIDENFPVIAIACDKENRDKMISNIREIKARNGILIALITEGDREIADLVDETIEIPETSDMLNPLLSVIPLQLFAYHTAVALGCNVDRPRNLAKSVTVE